MKHPTIYHFLVLFLTSGIVIRPARAGCSMNVTITDGPIIQVDENQTVLPVTFSRMGDMERQFTVIAKTNADTAKGGSDFISVNETVTFGINISTVTANFTILDDAKLENQIEIFFINITEMGSSVLCSPFASVVIKIKDNDKVEIGFHKDFRSFRESYGNVSIKIFKTPDLGADISLTVRYFTPGIGNATINTDYKNASKFVSIPALESTDIEDNALTIIDNDIVEYTKCFNVSMDGTHPNVIFPRQSMICILNDDKVTIEFRYSNISVDEQLGFITVPIIKTGRSAIPINVRLILKEEYSTAKKGFDYEDLPQKVITFEKDVSETAFNVTLKNDDDYESTESLIITMEAIDSTTTVIGSNNLVVLRIIDKVDTEIHLKQQRDIEAEQERRTMLMTYLLFAIVGVLLSLILIFICLTCTLAKKMKRYNEF